MKYQLEIESAKGSPELYKKIKFEAVHSPK